MVKTLREIGYSDIKQALNILDVATKAQLREVEKSLRLDLLNVEGSEGRAYVERILDILYYVKYLTKR